MFYLKSNVKPNINIQAETGPTALEKKRKKTFFHPIQRRPFAQSTLTGLSQRFYDAKDDAIQKFDKSISF